MSGQVVTFYSYKGGVGRSFLLANVAVLLARWGYKVLCVDWDLEAPGLRHYFLPWMKEERPGVIDLVGGYAGPGGLRGWTRMVNRVVIDAPRVKFDFISAGLPGEQYFDAAQKIQWRTLYEETEFGRDLEELRATWKRTYDFVLVDSRTGVSDLAGVSTVHLPDMLAFIFTANRQSIEGSAATVERLVRSRGALPFDRERMACIPVLSRFASDKEYKIAAEWMEVIEGQMAGFYVDWISRDIPIRALLPLTRIPEVAYWTFGERLPLVEDASLDRDPQSINYALTTVGALVARRLAGVKELLLNRDSYVAQAEKPRPAAAADPQAELPVYISASRGAQNTANELSDSLSVRNFSVLTLGDGPSERWRDDLLRQLRNARYLVVLISGELGEFQNAEIEQFFSLTVRGQADAGIFPVVLDDAGLNAIPPLLRSRQIIDGRGLPADGIAEKLQALIDDTRQGGVSHLKLV